MNGNKGREIWRFGRYIVTLSLKSDDMDALDSIKQPIAQELQRFNALFSETMQHDNPLLHVALQHILQQRGKQMRPILILLSAKLYGEVSDAVLHAAVAMELLHTASLVHDDVVDESNRRRGQQSINALLDNKAAVLVGDFLLSKALQAAAQTGSVDFVHHMAGLGLSLADGELVQLDTTHRETFEEATYYEVVAKKTASLFATCAQVAVMLGEGTADDAERMRQFGKLLGICFQLRDDIFDFIRLDVGKPAGHDMKEGKLTLPVLFALRKGGEQDKEMRHRALAVRQGEATDADIAALVEYTRQQGGLQYAQWAMDEFRMMALGLIPEDGPADIVQAFHAYVDFVAERLV